MTSSTNYPPKEILEPIFGKPDYELIILWILNNNEVCTWADLKEKINHSTLSIYLNKLKNRGYVEKAKFNQYRISSKGRDRFYEISQAKGKKRKLSFPPKVILRRRNYDHWILWMLYNNNYCKWADFLEDPLQINQSSLSKNMNELIDKGFVKKENKEYRITELGKAEYSNMLRLYDLDRQSILEEESKRIKEITRKTLKFFEKFQIYDNELKFRFLNIILKLPFGKIKSPESPLDEDDFNKIILFLSMNHPNQYPDYTSPEEFTKKYEIEQVILNYHVLLIVEKNVYPIKFFRLEVSNGRHYYFQAEEKRGRMLNVIVEDYVTKLTYLNKLHEETPFETSPLTIEGTVASVLDEICDTLFDNGLRESLRKFLPNYINYLAYKIERERKLVDTYDKLEGLIWQEIQVQFSEQNIFINHMEKNEIKEAIREIDKAIKLNPKNLDLYYSKTKILFDAGKYKEVIPLLDKMLKDFPQKEKDIQMKRAYVLKEMRNPKAGLEIIEELLEKHPEDNDLLNYKACWLQYLNRKEESLEVIQNLIERVPDNATYHDTYGEILMFFSEHEAAIDEFLKAMEMSKNDWYVYQTYIKLGICYKELENYDLAIQNLQKGKELTDKSFSDIDTRRKWLIIADLFLAEIAQLQAEF